jgi:tetratricopeptide (TPR) repeat protein
LRALFCLLFAGCAAAVPPTPPPPAPLPAPPAPVAPASTQAERDLEAARAAYEKDPTADHLIWVGRRLGYLGRYQEAIDVYTEGIARYPADARFLRHRGHRYITLRRFDDAIADLQKATELTRGKPDEIEPDGQPNPRNVPIGSLQSNICYHLGLAHYLKGDFERALGPYRSCVASASNPDRLVSSSHWLYMTLRRLGRQADAEAVLEAVNPGLDVIENISYHKLMLMYRGEIAPEELLNETLQGTDGPTILYGVGNWYLYSGNPARAEEIFRRVISLNVPAAFGTIAAEAELARGVR